MFDRRAAALVVLALAAAIGLSAPGFSSAAYTSTTSSSASITAAADWTPPVVSMVAPPLPVTGTVTLTANASDANSGVRDVAISYQPVGGSTWISICTKSSAPYACSWDSRAVTDGGYDVRAVATDRAGYSTTSDAVRANVANTTRVVLNEPNDAVRGSVPLSATVLNAGSLTYTVRIESSPAGASTWKTVCSNLSSPYSCSWVTTSGHPSGDYDLRAVATSGGSTLTSAVVTDITVDNVNPTVSLTDPGTPLRGTRTFAATASDAHSGIDQVVIQYAVSGSSMWKVLCTLADEPYTCRFDTTTITDGTYSFRAIATDLAGNTLTSSLVSNHVIDNTVSSVSLEDPGALLSGAATLSATASSTAGITSVRIQYAATGGSTWTDVCTDATSPYTCAWDTTKVADGAYDLRAVLLDGRGTTTISASVTNRAVDNVPLRGADVQSTNGGATAGRFDSGDTITFTYTDRVKLGTVTSGWTGTAQAVTVRLRDGNLLSLGNKGDTLDVQRTDGGAVNLGSVNLREAFVKNKKTVTFAATMTAGTVTVNGVVSTKITLVLGAGTNTQSLQTTKLAAAMVWTPSAMVTDLIGRACSTAPVTESGASDVDF